MRTGGRAMVRMARPPAGRVMTESPAQRREKDVLLDRLYEMLGILGMRPADLVRELRRDRIRVRALSELSIDQLRAQVSDAERASARHRRES